MSRVSDDDPNDDRRAFLKNCGKFAALTPPAVTFLLSTSMSSKAIAASGGKSHGDVPVAAVGGLIVGAGTGVAVAPHGHPAAAPPVQAAPPPAAPPPPAPPPSRAPLPPEVIRAGERG